MFKKEIIYQLKKYLEILKKEGIPVYKAYLYGSYAKNNFTTDSDIDILIITSKKLDIKQKAKAWNLTRKVNVKIEPFLIDLDKFKNENSIIGSIAKKEGIEI